MTADRTLTERFSTRVNDDARERPTSAAPMLDRLRNAHRIDAGGRVACIDAGTCISTPLWRDAGHNVVAIEPDGAMRAAAEVALPSTPRLQRVAAIVDATTLDDASVDLVSAAQAFHWVDTAPVKRGWARTLRPRRLAAVLWNSRVLDGSKFFSGDECRLRTVGTHHDRVAERYEDDATMQRRFGDGMGEAAPFDNRQRVDFDGSRGRLLSSSYTPQPGHPGCDAMVASLQLVSDSSAKDDDGVGFADRTPVFAGRLS